MLYLPVNHFQNLLFRDFIAKLKTISKIFSRTKIFYDAVQKIHDEAKRGATSSKMLTNRFCRVVTLASLAEYIYTVLADFIIRITK